MMKRNTGWRRALILLICALCVPSWAQGEGAALAPEAETAALPSAYQKTANRIPAEFVRVDLLIPDVVQDMRYAGKNNFVGRRIDGYEAPVALLTRQAAAALSRVADAVRPMGYRVCVYDAYRPKQAVEHFVRWGKDDKDTWMQEIFYPAVRKQTLFAKGYISKTSSHMRGSAVDVTLVDADGIPLDMGSAFDLFGPISAHGAKGLTPEQRANRKFLCSLMTEHGFRAYAPEWWHYTLKNEPFPTKNFSFPVLDRVQVAGGLRFASNRPMAGATKNPAQESMQDRVEQGASPNLYGGRTRMAEQRGLSKKRQNVPGGLLTAFPSKEIRIRSITYTQQCDNA